MDQLNYFRNHFILFLVLAWSTTAGTTLRAEPAAAPGTQAPSEADLPSGYQPEDESIARHITDAHGLTVGPQDTAFLQVKVTPAHKIRLRFGPNGPKPALRLALEKALGWTPHQVMEFNLEGYREFLSYFHSKLDPLDDEGDAKK